MPVGERALQSIWILRDVTASKQAEQEREAARSAMALAEVSAILAHEIRNPLASMELFAGLIAEDRRADFAVGVASARRDSFAVGNGEQRAEPERWRQPRLRCMPIELPACVASGVEFVRPIAEQAGVALSFRSAKSELKIQGNEKPVAPDHAEPDLQCDSSYAGWRRRLR